VEKEKVSSGNIIDWSVVRRLMNSLRLIAEGFVTVIVLTFLLGILAPIRPLLIQYTLDNDVPSAITNAMVTMMLILTALLVFNSIAQYIHTYLSGWLGQQVIRDIRAKLYAHVVNLRLKFFDKTPIGRLVTRTISDVENVSRCVQRRTRGNGGRPSAD
jgi:ATP-binding cassette subfamily B protein